MKKIKLEIKNRFTGKILFEYESEGNTLRQTILKAISEGANLSGADLSGADLRSADLRSANLSGADLSGADLSGADLRSANLRSANLGSADLSGADLSGADLSGADLRSADLRSANLEPIKNDMFIVLLHAIKEIPHLKKAVIEGRIDGSTYDGVCSCLSGTLCANAPDDTELMKIKSVRSVNRPIEMFFLSIKPGDTPKNKEQSKIVLAWIEEFETLLKG